MGKNTFSTHLVEYLTEYTHTEDISNTSHTVDNACNILCAFIQFKIPNISVGIKLHDMTPTRFMLASTQNVRVKLITILMEMVKNIWLELFSPSVLGLD